MFATLMRRNAWDPFAAMRRELGNWIGQCAAGGDEVVRHYPVDIHEDKDFIHVHAEMPGFKKDEIEVTLENGVLSIGAQRKSEEVKGESHLSERRFTRIARAFTLPNTVDEGKVEASLVDGVLTLKLHKREEVKARKIQVN